MNILGFLRTRQWVYIRRLVLVVAIVVLGVRNYGHTFTSWLRGPDREHDIVVTQAEFRPDIGETKPAWVIGLRNASARYTYDQIELEATYKDETGKVLETDRLIVRQKLMPGQEQLIASTDVKNRPGATSGTLKVLNASSVEP